MSSSTIGVIVLVLTIISYATEIIPLPMTAVCSCLIMAVTGASSFSKAFSGFGNDTLMMVVGMTIVGDALFATGGANLIGSKIVKAFGKTEKMFILACTIITAVLSAFLSNSATAAMMFPIMAAAIASSNGKLTKKYSYMAVGFGAIAGGGCTLIGSTPQVIAQGLLEEAGMEGASFFTYLGAGLPKVLILVVYFLTIGFKLGQKTFNFEEPEDDTEIPEGEQKLTPRIVISILILLGCIIGFISGLWTLGGVAMVGGALCVITKCIDFKPMIRNLDWTTIIVVGGSLGFASCIDESGAGEVIANFTVGLLGEDVSPIILISVLGFLAVVMGNLMTHTSTSAILVPITIYIAQGMGINVRSAVLAIVMFTNITYCTPIMTPAATMTLAAGYRFKDYVRVGGLLNVISYAAMVAMLPVLFQF